jgi:hypothetical protein
MNWRRFFRRNIDDAEQREELRPSRAEIATQAYFNHKEVQFRLTARLPTVRLLISVLCPGGPRPACNSVQCATADMALTALSATGNQ